MSEIGDIKKILDKHEKRISDLEKLLTGNKPFEFRKKKGKTSIIDLIIEVREEGFFDKPRFRDDIVKKFEELGHIYGGDSLNSPLSKALKSRILGRKKINGKWGYVKR